MFIDIPDLWCLNWAAWTMVMLGWYSAAAAGGMAVYNALAKGSQEKSSDKQRALDLINQYRAGMQQTQTMDPAMMIKQALEGMRRKKMSQWWGKSKAGAEGSIGQSLYDTLSPEARSLVDSLGDPSTYNLTGDAESGYTWNPPKFDPTVGENIHGETYYNPDGTIGYYGGPLTAQQKKEKEAKTRSKKAGVLTGGLSKLFGW